MHPTFQYFVALNVYRGSWFTIDSSIMNFFAYMVISYLMATALTLLVEIPFINLEKEFIFKRRSNPDKSVEDSFSKAETEVSGYSVPKGGKKEVAFGKAVGLNTYTEDGFKKTKTKNGTPKTDIQ